MPSIHSNALSARILMDSLGCDKRLVKAGRKFSASIRKRHSVLRLAEITFGFVSERLDTSTGSVESRMGSRTMESAYLFNPEAAAARTSPFELRIAERKIGMIS